MVNGDFRKINRNMVKKNASGVNPLPEIIQDKENYYEEDKQPHNTKKTRASTLELFQTSGFKANSGNGNKVQYKSSKLLKFILSDPPTLQDRNFKRDYNEKRGSMIHFEPNLKDLKIYKSSMLHNNFQKDSENSVTKDNAIPYDANTKDIKISRLPKIQNQNFKKDIEKLSTVDSTIHFKNNTYPNELKILKLPMFKSLSENPVTVIKTIYSGAEPNKEFYESPMLTSINSKNGTEKEVGRSSIIYFDKGRYLKDKMNVEAITQPVLQVNRVGRVKREAAKEVVDSTIHFKSNTYPNESKILKLPMFKRLSENPVTKDNTIHSVAEPKEFYESPMLKNINSKNGIVKEVDTSSMIYFDKGRYLKDKMNIEAITLPMLQVNQAGRVKREVAKDSNIFYDADRTSKIGKGIKILEQEPGDSGCNYNQCVEICNTIYFAIPIHLAQCYNNSCFCFPKKDLYPPVIKNFMKTHKLFGIQQTYE